MEVIPLISDFSGGMKSDFPINQIPPGAVRYMEDALPLQDGSASKRGGWKWASKALTGGGHTPNAVQALAYAPIKSLTTKGYLGLVITKTASSGSIDLYHFDGLTTADGTLIGTWGVSPDFGGAAISEFQSQNPVYAPPLDGMIVPGWREIFRGGQAANTTYCAAGDVRKVTAPAGVWTIAALGGSPPAACVAAMWGSYLILANAQTGATQSAVRLWFSAPGNVESWALTSSYVDTPEEVVAIYAKDNMIFVFGPTGTHILTGDTPPPGGNLTLRPFAFKQGCLHPQSVVGYKDSVIWANQNGIWKSSGGQPVNLCVQGGIYQTWQEFFRAGAVGVACGVRGPWLHVSLWSQNFGLLAGNGVHFVCNLETNSWFKFSNMAALCMATIPASFGTDWGDELVMGWNGSARTVKTAAIFQPGIAATAYGPPQDDDSNGPNPQIVTGAFKMGENPGKRVRKLLANYTNDGDSTFRLTITASVDPIIAPGDNMGFGTINFNLFSGGYGGPTANPLVTRQSYFVKRRCLYLQLKMVMTIGPATTKAMLYSLDVEREGDDNARRLGART